MPDNRLPYLFTRYYNKTATEAEREELQQLLGASPGDEQLTTLLKNAWEALGDPAFSFPSEQRTAILQDILQTGKESRAPSATPEFAEAPMSAPHRLPWWRLAAAAILVMAGFAGIHRWMHTHDNVPGLAAKKVLQDVPPGGNKAVLVLGDGSAITLDSAASGKLSVQGGTQVLKQGDGQLAYRPSLAHPGAIVYNTLTTPRGGQYKIVLPDGSKVWLNAASSLRFPSSFSGKDRQVTITGEAYFEVAPDKTRPFNVQANGTSVEVLGTHFNIMAYDDEKVLATTLLEGSVKVVNGQGQALLSPGEQAGLNKETGSLRVVAADTSEAVAWKNEQFAFTDMDLRAIMRQLSRWYDIQVTFVGDIPQREIRGSISRNYNISEVLKMLAFTAGIRYTIDGKDIIINNQN